jgi:hypothetical protein
MRAIVIPVHSFIDVITNSSSEIFVQASNGTIRAIETLINDILSLGGSTLKCSDLFKIDIVSTYHDYRDGKYNTIYLTDGEYNDLIKSGVDEDNLERQSDNESNLRVTPLENSVAANAAAKTLSSLTDLFNIESEYNG